MQSHTASSAPSHAYAEGRMPSEQTCDTHTLMGVTLWGDIKAWHTRWFVTHNHLNSYPGELWERADPRKIIMWAIGSTICQLARRLSNERNPSLERRWWKHGNFFLGRDFHCCLSFYFNEIVSSHSCPDPAILQPPSGAIIAIFFLN